jgi:flagellar hook assembly protein FlgD
MQLPANYPNPFNGSTTVSYGLSQSGYVRLTILDLQGRRVRTLWQGWRMPGEYHVLWNGDTDTGVPAGTGLYLVRLQSESGEEWLKMSLVK